MKEKLEGILRLDPTVPEHPNWKDFIKEKRFFDSFNDFYAKEFKDRIEWMENKELDEYIFVGLDFIGIGATYSNVLSVIPYSSEDDFTDVVFDLLKEYESLAVFVSKESNEIYLNGMVERTSDKLNVEYDGNIMEYTYEPGGEIMPAEKGDMVLTGYWKRKQKAEKYIQEFIMESGIPLTKIDNIDGSILYSFTANTDYGPVYGFELTADGFIDLKFATCEPFDIPTESQDARGIQFKEAIVFVRKQNNVIYKN